MKIKLPYLESSSEQDIIVTLLLAPLWWLSGCSVFIYQAVTFLVFLKILILLTMNRKPVILPQPSLWLGYFLIAYLSSVFLNSASHNSQRIFASFNNFSFFLMGFLLIAIIANCDIRKVIPLLLRTGRTLCFVTGVFTLLVAFLWFWKRQEIETTAWLGHFFPSLLSYPYFYMLLTIKPIMLDWQIGDFPRVSVYSLAHIASGGLMAMLLPLFIACYHFKKRIRSVSFFLIFLIAVSPLLFSLSRTAISAFIGAAVLVHVLEQRNKLLIALISALLALLISNYLYSGIEWMINVRGDSTLGRLAIYREALEIVVENNLLMGMGVRMREGFTMMAVGSHSTYVGLLLVTGILGVTLFLLFQGSVFVRWYRLKKNLRTEEEKICWKYFGMSLVGGTGSLLTSSLDALPFIAFTYFLIVAVILSLDRLKHHSSDRPPT